MGGVFPFCTSTLSLARECTLAEQRKGACGQVSGRSRTMVGLRSPGRAACGLQWPQGGARCCVKPFCPDTLQTAFPSRLCVASWIRPSVCQAAARGEQWLGSPGKGSALSRQVTDCGCNPSPAEPAASGSCQLSALGAEAGTLAPAVPLASAGQLCQAQQTNLLASSCKSRPYPLLILAALCPPSRPLPWPTCPELGPLATGSALPDPLRPF